MNSQQIVATNNVVNLDKTIVQKAQTIQNNNNNIQIKNVLCLWGNTNRTISTNVYMNVMQRYKK